MDNPKANPKVFEVVVRCDGEEIAQYRVAPGQRYNRAEIQEANETTPVVSGNRVFHEYTGARGMQIRLWHGDGGFPGHLFKGEQHDE